MILVKKRRVSPYNTYLKLNKIPGKSLIIQGYRGSFDVVDDHIADILRNEPEDIEDCGISPEMISDLPLKLVYPLPCVQMSIRRTWNLSLIL